jgi:hypothetical protein
MDEMSTRIGFSDRTGLQIMADQSNTQLNHLMFTDSGYYYALLIKALIK